MLFSNTLDNGLKTGSVSNRGTGGSGKPGSFCSSLNVSEWECTTTVPPSIRAAGSQTKTTMTLCSRQQTTLTSPPGKPRRT